MKTFGERLKEVRIDRGFKTLTSLANRIGGKTTHASISGWEKDNYKPDAEAANKLVKILKVNWNYLETGKGSKDLDDLTQLSIDSNMDYMYKYPVLEWEYIHKGVENVRNLNRVAEFNSSYKGSDCFALVINNESMMPEFKVGEKILVDRLASVKSGDYCVVQQEDKSYVLRLFVKDGSDQFIKSINPDWPNKIKAIDGTMNIIGKIVEAKRNY